MFTAVYRGTINLYAITISGDHKPGKPEHGKRREFSGNSVQPQGKIVTNKVV